MDYGAHTDGSSLQTPSPPQSRRPNGPPQAADAEARPGCRRTDQDVDMPPPPSPPQQPTTNSSHISRRRTAFAFAVLLYFLRFL